MLNAFTAQGLAASGWVKDVEIDKSAEAVGTGYRKRCKTEEIAEAKSLTAVLDKKELARKGLTVESDVGQPGEKASKLAWLMSSPLTATGTGRKRTYGLR